MTDPFVGSPARSLSLTVGDTRTAPGVALLVERAFGLSTAVRYVATYVGGTLELNKRPALNASSAESDWYEETIVNPTLITMLQQRGQIDCGGLAYVLVRYGAFFQFVAPLSCGHLSVALDVTPDVVSLANRLHALVGESGFASEGRTTL